MIEQNGSNLHTFGQSSLELENWLNPSKGRGFAEFFLKLGTTENQLLHKLKVCRDCISAFRIRERLDERVTRRVRSEKNPPTKSVTRLTESSFHILVRDYELFVENGELKSNKFEPRYDLFENNISINSDHSELDNSEINEEQNKSSNENDFRFDINSKDTQPADSPNHADDFDRPSGSNDSPDLDMNESHEYSDNDQNGGQNDIFLIGELEDEILSGFADESELASVISNRCSDINRKSSQKTNSSSNYAERLASGQGLFVQNIGKSDKMVILENSSNNLCCFCNNYVDEVIGHRLTRSIVRRLEENGLVEERFTFGDGFSIFFKDEKKQLEQYICFDCLEIADKTVSEGENFYFYLNERIFQKKWLMAHKEGLQPTDFSGFFSVSRHNPDFDTERIGNMFKRFGLRTEDEWKLTNREDRSNPSNSPKFYFSDWILFRFTGLDEFDLDDLTHYLLEYQYDRNFLRAVDIREAVIILFVFLRQKYPIETLTALITDKKSQFDVPFVIKSETVTNILYRTAYVLAGRNPFSNLPKQFHSNFDHKNVFQKPSLGSYVSDFLGWDQERLTDANFVFSTSSSIFHKLRTSRTSQEILEAYKSFENETDQFVKAQGEREMAFEIHFYADCTYLKMKSPGDIYFAQKLYNAYKKGHLTKPMIYCFSGGYVIDASGPWATDGRHNDASILEIEAKNNDSLRKFFAFWKVSEKKIKLIADRGFRDSVKPLLKEFEGYFTVEIPPLQQTQKTASGKPSHNKRNVGDFLSTEKANTARIISIERSIVENINMLIKTYNFFDQKSETTYVFNGFQNQAMRIICSLFNRRYYRKGMIQRDASGKICRLNWLKAYYVARFQEGKCIRESKLGFAQSNTEFFNYRIKGSKLWVNIGPETAEFSNFQSQFPEITYDPTDLKKDARTTIPFTDIIHFAIGEYHPKNAKKYLSSASFLNDHFFMQKLNIEELSNISRSELLNCYPDWNKKSLHCIRFKIPAQYRPGHEHKVYVLFSSSPDVSENVKNEPDWFFISTIVDYYCDCFTGARSFGCCSHVAAALLGARMNKHQKKAKFGTALYADRQVLTGKNYGNMTEENSPEPEGENSSDKVSSDLTRENVDKNEDKGRIQDDPAFFVDEFNESFENGSEFGVNNPKDSDKKTDKSVYDGQNQEIPMTPDDPEFLPKSKSKPVQPRRQNPPRQKKISANKLILEREVERWVPNSYFQYHNYHFTHIFRTYDIQKRELLNENLNPKDVICTPPKFIMKYEDLKALCLPNSSPNRQRYLSDNMINSYLSLALNTKRISIPINAFVFNANFGQILKHSFPGREFDLNYLNDFSIVKDANFLSSSVLLFPTYVSFGHWILIIINRDEKTITQIDSLNNDFFPEIETNFKNFLEAKIPGEPFESEYSFLVEKSARQCDSASCGLYTIMNILAKLNVIDFQIESNNAFLKKVKLIMIHESISYARDSESFIIDVLGSACVSQ